MTKKLLFLIVIGIALAYGTCLAEAPSQVAGFKLGTDISLYKDRVDMSTALPVRYAESISEVEINATGLLASGLIAYGTCADPGKVLRIKLKYADSGRDFYNKLLTQFEKKFGKPDEWRGDPFHIVIAWKWSFVDKAKNRISLILQHNKLDTDEKIGNSIKLTLTDAIEKERLCYEKSRPAASVPPAAAIDSQINWDTLIPK